jgi:hypothetical protein
VVKWHYIYADKVTNDNDMKTFTPTASILKVLDQQLLKLLQADLAQFKAKKALATSLPKAA